MRHQHRRPTLELERTIRGGQWSGSSKRKTFARHVIRDHDEVIDPRSVGRHPRTAMKLVRNWTLHATKGWRSNLEWKFA